MSIAIEFRNVDIIFGAKAQRRPNGAIQQALAALDSGGNRADIAVKTGVVIGVANACLTVERGQISVLMATYAIGDVQGCCDALDRLHRHAQRVLHRQAKEDLHRQAQRVLHRQAKGRLHRRAKPLVHRQMSRT